MPGRVTIGSRPSERSAFRRKGGSACVFSSTTTTFASEDIKKTADQLAYFGQGPTSVFARRARELFTTTRVDGAIDENVAIQRELEAVDAHGLLGRASLSQSFFHFRGRLSQHRTRRNVIYVTAPAYGCNPRHAARAATRSRR